MTKLLFTTTLVLLSVLTFAQRGKVSTALSYKESGKLDKAWEAIQETIDPANPKSEKTINWNGTWQARGEIIEAIILSKDEKYKNLVAEPVEEAYKSYMKAIELDEKGGNPIFKLKLVSFSNVLINAAVAAFQENSFDKSTDYFEKKLLIDKLPLFKTDATIDTAIIYNTGLSAMNAKQYTKAIKYFTECTKYGYNTDSPFSQIISAYQLLKTKEDTAASVEVMKQGLEKYPSAQSINVQLINYYIMIRQDSVAMQYLDKAIAKEKDNVSFYLAKGVALDRLKRTDEAIEVYKQAIEVKPESADAYYNIGVIYFNRGVKQFDIANSIPTSDLVRYEAEKKKADALFANAVPFLENAVKYNPADTYIADQLKNLYYRLKMMDKFNALDKK
jgi:tetratricopeptide (TPR) repeat protein